MAAFLDRYYALLLVLLLPAPLWVSAVLHPEAARSAALQDAFIWTMILLTGWIVVRKFPRYRIRGDWRPPTGAESRRYHRFLLAVLIIDFGSKALFFRWDRPHRVEIFKNFGFHSVFHATEFETFHIYLLIYFVYLFFLAPRYFRFANPAYDRIWAISSASAMGGAIALVSERLVFGGVHNSFYFAGPLMWICPPCASARFISYAWTPADFFVHAAFLPFLVLIASYFNPRRNPVETAPQTSITAG